MSAVHAPPWLDQESATTAASETRSRPAGNPGWYPGMKSPNPAGRPKGSTPKTKLMQRMLDDADGIIAAVVAKALEGDTGAASLILSRLVPALKAQTEKVQFSFDVSAPASEQVEAILSAISNGIIATDVGKQIIEAIGALAEVRATEELEARIATLEEKHRG